MSAAEQDQTIVALEQKTVIFMDDELIAVRAKTGTSTCP